MKPKTLETQRVEALEQELSVLKQRLLQSQLPRWVMSTQLDSVSSSSSSSTTGVFCAREHVVVQKNPDSAIVGQSLGFCD